MNIDFFDQEKRNREKEDHWYNLCSRKNVPFVVTRKRSSLGDVHWDCMSVNPNDDAFVYSQEKYITRELSELVEYYKNPRIKIEIGAFTGTVKNISNEYVNEFALDVCNTLSSAYKRHENRNNNGN